MRAHQPRYDVKMGTTRLSDVGLHSRILSIKRNRNNDRQSNPGPAKPKKDGGAGTGAPHTGRGKRLARINSVTVTLDNKDGELTDIMRLGRKMEIFLGYEDYPLTRAGIYIVEKPKWTFPSTGSPTITLSALGKGVKLAKIHEAMRFERRSHSEIAEEVARKYGMRPMVSPTREKMNLSKADDETLLDFMERIASDIGYDFGIDDSEDPAVLHFEPPDAREAIQIGGKTISIGYGADTTATIRASDLTVEWTIPVGNVSRTQRDKSGHVTSIANQLGGAGRIREDTHMLATPAANTAPAGGEKKRNERIADAATSKRVLSFKMRPGVPWWNLNQLVPLVDMGMLNGMYRLVDLTDDVGPKGYEFDARAIIGGGKASKNQQKGGEKSIEGTNQLGGAFRIRSQGER